MIRLPRGGRRWLIVCSLAATFAATGVSAQTEPPTPKPSAPVNEIPGSDTPVRQRPDDAWWTGPAIANSPSSLAPGHVYVESYLFDVKSPGSDGIGSRTFLLYGLTDRLTVGLIPSFGFNKSNGGQSSSGVGLGDLALHAQYRLTSYSAGRWIPTTAVALEESLPTGRYDRLTRLNDGFGAGAYTTSLSWYAQSIFWLPNGRILRSRVNLSRTFASRADVESVSIYGTPSGFRGSAHTGASLSVDSSWEYSLSRGWALAIDVLYRHGDKTDVYGSCGPRSVCSNSDPTDNVAVAPAVEFSWAANLGVLVGVRYIPNGTNTKSSVTPVIALSVLI